MKVRLDETLFKARAQENLAMTNEIDKLEQVDALVECLDHFVADRKWVDEITRDELLTMVTQSHGDKDALVESVLAKFNTPCIDAKKLKECRERRQNKGLKESMKKRKSLKESDTRDTFTLDTSNTPILDCGLYYSLLGELDPGRYDERFKEFEECVKECAEPILDELVRKTPNFEVVSVGTYYHPRYYNYETDCLEFTVKYTGDELGTVIEEYANNQDFIDFLQNYKSYDGFISFYADNKDEFVTQDYIKSVSQIIKYNVTQEDYERANEELYYDVSDCGFYPEDEYDEDETDESLKEKKYARPTKDARSQEVKRARESKENKNLFAYRIYMRDKDKDFASGKDYKDAKSMLKDAKKDFELANNELRTNPKYLICMLFDLVDGEYYHYKDLYSAKEIEDEIKLEETPSKKESKSLKKESKKLKEDYTPSPMSATDFFDSFDFTIYKSTDEDGDPCYKLRDKQGANLGDIEDDTFQSISDAVNRLDMYYEDYIINDLSEIAPELSGLHSGNYEDVFNKIKDMDKTADGHSVRGHKALLYYILHPEQLKDDVRELTESKKLKEGYDYYEDYYARDIANDLEYGYARGEVYTPQQTASVSWELDINGNKEEDFHCADFFNYLLNDIAYPVRDGYLSYGGLDTIIPSDFNENFDRKDFKHDLEMLGVYDKASFDKFYRNKDNSYELEFWIDYDTNFDADEYGQLCDDEELEEDEIDESFDRYSKETKDFANKLCRLAKKDNRQLKFEDACEVIDQSFNNKVDNIEDFYKTLNFDESLKEGKQPLYRVVKNPKGKGYCILKRVNKNDKANTFINDYSKEVFNTTEEAKAMLDKVDKLHFHIEESLNEDASPINNSILAKKMGAKFLPPKDYGVKKSKPRYVYEIYYYDTEDCTGDPIFREFSSRKAQEEWYEKHKDDPDKFDMYAYPYGSIYENLKESTIPVKDLLIKTDNKYGITLDHAIDDIKRERGYNDPLFGDNGVIDLLMKRYGLEKRDVIRVLNYKFDGKVLDEGCGRKKTSKRAK